MSTTRKVPHCRTCHRPLKGHKRGVCDTTTSDPPPAPTRSRTKGARKSAPLPLETLISPQSSQILNDLLRTNSHSAPAPSQVPQAKRTLRSTSAAREAETLHVMLERLSANDREQNRTPTERAYTPEADETESLDMEPTVVTPTNDFAVSRQLSSDSDTDTTIQDLLNNMSRSSRHPPATIFSLPANKVSAFEDGAERLGLFVHVLPLPPSANEDWLPVVVGRDAGAVAKLLDDSEKLAQAVRKSGTSNVSEFRVGMSHIVAGTLGALTTWAGLAYS